MSFSKKGWANIVMLIISALLIVINIGLLIYKKINNIIWGIKPLSFLIGFFLIFFFSHRNDIKNKFIKSIPYVSITVLIIVIGSIIFILNTPEGVGIIQYKSILILHSVSSLLLGLIITLIFTRITEIKGFLGKPPLLILTVLILVCNIILGILIYNFNPTDDGDGGDDEKDKKDDGDDEKDDDESSKKKSSEKDDSNINGWYIVLGLVIIILLFGVLFLFPFSLPFILIGAWLIFSNFTDVRRVILPLPQIFDKPLKADKNLKYLKKILKNLNDFKMDNKCKIDNQIDCNYLYKEYIKSKDSSTLNKLLNQLENLKTENGENDKSGLINQAIYILYELISCKLSLKSQEAERYGTIDWWKQNIFISDDPIQQFIWLLSFGLCVLFICYNFYIICKNSSTIFDIAKTDLPYLFIGCLIIGLLSILLTGLYIGLISKNTSKDKVIEKNIDKEYEKYEHTDNKLSFDSGSYIGWSSFFVILIILGIVNFFTYKTEVLKNKNYAKVARVAFVSLIMTLVLFFNSYYAFFIPQLVIIGLILQKYILSTSINGDILPTIIKIVLFIFILIISFYNTTYNTKNLEKDILKEDTADIITNVGGEYNKQIWYIFGMFMLFIIQNIYESFKYEDLTKIYPDTQWSLLLTPVARTIINFTRRTESIVFDDISVKNTIVDITPP